MFPDVAKRRVAGTIYLVLAVTCLAQWSQSSNRGMLAVAVLLARDRRLPLPRRVEAEGRRDRSARHRDAAPSASPSVTRPAQLAWYGLRSRPAWRILLYSADEPPSLRGLVECDGVDGHVIGEYTETNPEDWSKYGLDDPAPTPPPPDPLTRGAGGPSPCRRRPGSELVPAR